MDQVFNALEVLDFCCHMGEHDDVELKTWMKKIDLNIGQKF